MAKRLTQAEIQARYNDDIIYLEGQGVDVSNIKTPAYAHRRAQAIRKAIEENQPLPSIKEQRGKTGGKRAGLAISHLPRQGHLLEQYQIEAKDTPRGELTLANLAYLIKNTPDPKEKYYLFVVHGVVDKASPLDEEHAGETQLRATYTYRADKTTTSEWLKRRPKTEEVYNFFHFLRPDIKWLKIEMVGIAYPK